MENEVLPDLILPNRILSYAKIMKGECNSMSGKRSFTRLAIAEPHLILCKDKYYCSKILVRFEIIGTFEAY